MIGEFECEKFGICLIESQPIVSTTPPTGLDTDGLAANPQRSLNGMLDECERLSPRYTYVRPWVRCGVEGMLIVYRPNTIQKNTFYPTNIHILFNLSMDRVIPVLINGNILYMTIYNILSWLSEHMILTRNGLARKWRYRGRVCIVVMSWDGHWYLYIISDTELVERLRPNTETDPDIMITRGTQDTILVEILPKYEHRDLSYETPTNGMFKGLSYYIMFINTLLGRN
jgi:hypothetical protein